MCAVQCQVDGDAMHVIRMCSSLWPELKVNTSANSDVGGRRYNGILAWMGGISGSTGPQVGAGTTRALKQARKQEQLLS